MRMARRYELEIALRASGINKPKPLTLPRWMWEGKPETKFACYIY